MTVDLSGITLNPTNNVVKTYYKIGKNLFKNNSGTTYGNFAPSASELIDLSIKDLSLYERYNSIMMNVSKINEAKKKNITDLFYLKRMP